MNVQFKEWSCTLVFTKYFDLNTAILLVDADDGSPVATATINLPDYNLADGEVAIKDYSENEGMFNVLNTAGVISDPIRFEATGFVNVPICKLLIKE